MIDFKEIIVSGPYTTAIFTDGSKVTVKCSEDDKQSFESAVTAIVLKRALGSRHKVVEFLAHAKECAREYPYKAGRREEPKPEVIEGNIQLIDPKDMTVKQKQEMALFMQEQGKSFGEIGEFLHISAKSAQTYARKAKNDRDGKLPREPKTEEEKIDVDKMINLLNTPGWTTHDVAVEFGVSEETIAKRYHEHTGTELER